MSSPVGTRRVEHWGKRPLRRHGNSQWPRSFVTLVSLGACTLDISADAPRFQAHFDATVVRLMHGGPRPFI